VAIEVREFAAGDVPSIDRLNGRLAAGGQPHRVGALDVDRVERQRREAMPIRARLYVAAEEDEIRGTVWLREQCFWSDGGAIRAGWAVYPVAESLVNGQAAGVPASLLFKLRREQPHLMALGMGGHTGSFAKLLAAARWPGSLVPFFFRILRPSRVLRRLAYARSTRVRRLVADGLAYSGAAWAANNVLTAARAAVGRGTRRPSTATAVDRFGDWADAIWDRSRRSYGLIAFRDSGSLNALYPDDFNRLTRLRVQVHGDDIGWACVRAIDAAGTWFERQFGDLRVGIITDALAPPADATTVIDAAVRHLAADGVDLIVTFQSHPAWGEAALNAGLLRGPSNCAFYRSPSVDAVIRNAASDHRHCHLTYSDGDGPERV